MLTLLRLGMLDDVRQRLLHEPVERRLDFAAAAASLRAPSGSRLGGPLLGERLDEPFERGHEAEVVERRRTELDGEAADVLQRLTTSSRSSASAARAVLRGASSTPRGRAGSRSAPARSRRGARARGAALDLLRLHDAAERVARDALRERDGDGGAGCENLGHAQVGVGEPGVAGRACRGSRARRSRPRAMSGTYRPVRAPNPSGPRPGDLRGRRTRSRCARCAGARARGPLFDWTREMLRPQRRRPRRPRRRTAARRPVGRASATTALRGARGRGRRRGRASWSRSVSRRGRTTSFSDSSWRDQRVTTRKRRAFSIATAAWAASSATSSWSSSVKSSPSFSR